MALNSILPWVSSSDFFGIDFDRTKLYFSETKK